MVIIGDGAQAAEAVRVVASRLRGGGAGLRRDAVAELARLGDEHPELRQDVAEAVCAFVRERPARDEHPTDGGSDPAGPEVRRADLAMLADRLRPAPDTAGPETARPTRCRAPIRRSAVSRATSASGKAPSRTGGPCTRASTPSA
ncbi:hypothetical protein [Streptomyces sp. ML-6]|uniref:hypothetical protein n=1 Tax=Streptomyces sp. ML-6 TaxID=2982693 RepID=UPI0024BF9B8F|nr:hypothetical protein [Streptomyces sp. ML-6]MDK0523848.1 hypothetical protein [Streptomyces sp. ML-6]